MMNGRVNGEMLALAREIRGRTQIELSRATGIDQARLSRYEKGTLAVRPVDLTTIAAELQFPEGFFRKPGRRYNLESGGFFHRKNQSMLIGDVNRMTRFVDLIQYVVEALLEDMHFSPALAIPQFRPEDFDYSIELIASSVRQSWHLDNGPIENLTLWLEAAGFLIFLCDAKTTHMSAFSQWIRPWPPIVVANRQMSGERHRFSLAHELGHLVMHVGLESYPEMEQEADNFAAAFLMPADAIRSQLEPVTFKHLFQLKSYWGVSMQALIRRAHDLEVIPERRYTSLFEQLSRAGYRRNEPSVLAIEQPRLFRLILKKHEVGLRKSIGDLCRDLELTEEDFREFILGESKDEQPRSPSLSIVDGGSEVSSA